MADVDVAVVGAGFGGLGAAVTLAESGARVALFEALKYPGGCASTFQRQGKHFDAGATLISGLDSHQYFGRLLARHGVSLPLVSHDPVSVFRCPNGVVTCFRDRARSIAPFVEESPKARAFFAEQARVANILWRVLDRDDLLPPFQGSTLFAHAKMLPDYLSLLRWKGRTLAEVLEHFDVARAPLLRAFCDALCQITVQCDAGHAEALFALAAMDYFYRGSAHIEGGVGTLAVAMARIVERASPTSELRFSDEVRSVERDGAWLRIVSRRGETRARCVVLNTLVSGAQQLVTGDLARSLTKFTSLEEQVQDGYGAVMLYLTLKESAFHSSEPQHFALYRDDLGTAEDGRHIFVSIAGHNERTQDGALRAPVGERTATVSTHARLPQLLRSEDRAKHVAAIQTKMRATLATLAPELADAVCSEMPGSPRTFARFTKRAHGAVGGIPRTTELTNYWQLGPTRVAPGFYLVGDSYFPGQSALATAIGGTRTATAILSRDLR